MQKWENITLEITDFIALIILRRPQVHNALNEKLISELDLALNSLEERKDVRAVILFGEGNSFAAGADIKSLSVMDRADALKFSEAGQKVFQKLSTLPVPVIAAINGYALGGGCELALACDIRIASENASFGMPEVSLGLIPGYSGTKRLTELIGYPMAMYLMSSAEIITAKEALRIGLVQKLSTPNDVLEVSMELAKKIAARGGQAVRVLKKVVRDGREKDFMSAAKMESREFSKLFQTAESIEGMNAFLEKRKPRW